jgi:hypothetical protein
MIIFVIEVFKGHSVIKLNLNVTEFKDKWIVHFELSTRLNENVNF